MCFVFVFFPFILDIKFVGRTSRGHTGGRSHRISHPPSFCGACLNFSREEDSAVRFPRRPCRILCTNDLIVLHLLGIFFFLVRKIPFPGIRTHIPTCQKVTRLLLSYRGVRVVMPFSLDVMFVDVPAGVGSHRKVTQDFSTFLLRCLP